MHIYPELMNAIKNELGGHRKTGKLSAEVSKWANYKKFKRGNQVGISVDIPLPYAAIREFGGRIPDRVPRKGRFMKFEGGPNYPGTWFLKKARGYTVGGWEYVSKGFRRWIKNYSNPGITVVWRD